MTSYSAKENDFYQRDGISVAEKIWPVFLYSKTDDGKIWKD